MNDLERLDGEFRLCSYGACICQHLQRFIYFSEHFGKCFVGRTTAPLNSSKPIEKMSISSNVTFKTTIVSFFRTGWHLNCFNWCTKNLIVEAFKSLQRWQWYVTRSCGYFYQPYHCKVLILLCVDPVNNSINSWVALVIGILILPTVLLLMRLRSIPAFLCGCILSTVGFSQQSPFRQILCALFHRLFCCASARVSD